MDPDHGATLRSNWSIDNSEELGNLAFGFSLDYDAVSRSYEFFLGMPVSIFSRARRQHGRADITHLLLFEGWD